MTEVKKARIRCPRDMVKLLTDDNSMLAVTINPTGVQRLAMDWLEMQEELVLLRKELETK